MTFACFPVLRSPQFASLWLKSLYLLPTQVIHNFAIKALFTCDFLSSLTRGSIDPVIPGDSKIVIPIRMRHFIIARTFWDRFEIRLTCPFGQRFTDTRTTCRKACEYRLLLRCCCCWSSSRPGALQYEMDTCVRLRLPNPGAFGESEEKKRGALGESRQKLAKIIKIFPNFVTFR